MSLTLALFSNLVALFGGILCDLVFTISGFYGFLATFKEMHKLAPWMFKDGAPLGSVYVFSLFAPLWRILIMFPIARDLQSAGHNIGASLILAARTDVLMAYEAARKTRQLRQPLPSGTGFCARRARRSRLARRKALRQLAEEWDEERRRALAHTLGEDPAEPPGEEVPEAAAGCCRTSVQGTMSIATNQRAQHFGFVYAILMPQTWWPPNDSLPVTLFFLLKCRYWPAVFGILLYIVRVANGVVLWWNPMSVVSLLCALNMLYGGKEVNLLWELWPLSTLGCIVQSRVAVEDLWHGWCVEMLGDFSWDRDQCPWELLARQQQDQKADALGKP